MLYLILSIICSVSVGVIFKIARKRDVAIAQIVAFNYITAICLCYIIYRPQLPVIDSSLPWHIYIPLTVLLPSIFLFLALSIKHMGIVKTDAAQRMSLFIPILAAWLIYGEAFNSYKWAGLAIGFPAIALILYKKQDNTENKWLYPAVVLLGFGVIDILFKQIAGGAIPYTTSFFIVLCGALVVAWLIALYKMTKGETIKPVNVMFGLAVGAFNFGNILFYLKAHKAFSDNPSTVFASMNMGVIVLGSLVGILAFKEKLTIINYVGIALALCAIGLITLSQLYA
ncbi:MAG: EamA/RhaT family transporter [Flavobacterium sp.]